VLTGSGR